MTNRIQELTVDETWRNEQDAWNNRSNYFVKCTIGTIVGAGYRVFILLEG